jgi:dTDP-D-glucose 4,6-dehydratase
MDSSKAKSSLDWCCNVDFSEGLVGVIDWYMNNTEWWAPITDGQYDLARLGSQMK